MNPDIGLSLFETQCSLSFQIAIASHYSVNCILYTDIVNSEMIYCYATRNILYSVMLVGVRHQSTTTSNRQVQKDSTIWLTSMHLAPFRNSSIITSTMLLVR